VVHFLTTVDVPARDRHAKGRAGTPGPFLGTRSGGLGRGNSQHSEARPFVSAGY
jgi:hypothetical protein